MLDKVLSRMCMMSSGHIKKADVKNFQFVGRMKSSIKDRKDALLFKHATLDIRVIAFAGASSRSDWKGIITKPLGVCSNLLVHGGIADMLESYSVSNVSAFGADYDLAGKCASGATLPWNNVILTGFSLGGALATLLATISNDTWSGTGVSRLQYRGDDIPHTPGDRDWEK